MEDIKIMTEKLTKIINKLLEEIDTSKNLSERAKARKIDALSKALSAYVRLVLMADKKGGITKQDLVKLLSESDTEVKTMLSILSPDVARLHMMLMEISLGLELLYHELKDKNAEIAERVLKIFNNVSEARQMLHVIYTTLTEADWY